MASEIDRSIAVFDANIASVRQLMNFDRDVLDLAIRELKSLREKLKYHHKLDNPQLSADNLIKVLQGVRDHDSLRGRYETIFNQALVLLVSYFGSAIGELFKSMMMHSLNKEPGSALLEEDIRVSLRELKEAEFNLESSLAEIFVEKQDISFQDMQSIGRSFKKYLGVDVPARDSSVNDIILGQAARHIIVHSGAIVDDRFVRQVVRARPRSVKPDLGEGSLIQFEPDEVEAVAASMKKYVDLLGTTLAMRMDSLE